MKLRLAQPQLLVDIARIKSLAYIREEGDKILIGATTTHYQLESSDLLKQICPLLPECAEKHWRRSGAQQRNDWRESRTFGSRGRLARGGPRARSRARFSWTKRRANRKSGRLLCRSTYDFPAPRRNPARDSHSKTHGTDSDRHIRKCHIRLPVSPLSASLLISS